mmetsp:Transcript_26683/g.64262  ORF Transcript_26683/g.64262 Transcript_26683/m.64262 type:complete len:120 (+) Transcript_26683:1754-2113(+)
MPRNMIRCSPPPMMSLTSLFLLLGNAKGCFLGCVVVAATQGGCASVAALALVAWRACAVSVAGLYRQRASPANTAPEAVAGRAPCVPACARVARLVCFVRCMANAACCGPAFHAGCRTG